MLSCMKQDAEPGPRWYAARSLPRHEKVVAGHFGCPPFEAYLPLYRAQRNWKGRRAEALLPLFPGYVFVRMSFADRLQVLRHPSVFGLVCFNGKPAQLPDDEINQLRKWLTERIAEPYPFLVEGKRVRVKVGPLAGLEGVLLRRKGCTRLIATIEAIERSIAFELDAADVELVL